MISPWLGIALVLAALGTLLVVLWLIQRRFAPHPEIVRKLLHVCMGLVTLCFPFLFREAWPVFALAASSILLMLSLKTVGVLKRSIGTVLSGSGRTESLGEICFPISVAILFHFYLHAHPGGQSAARQSILYYVPILLLTLSDAAAALVGVKYGAHKFATAEGHKSIEGSAALFASAFVCIYLALLFLTDTRPVERMMIATLLAMLAAAFEAVSWKGLDNLLLPLSSYLLLLVYFDAPVNELLRRFAITAVLVGVLGLFYKRATLQGDGVLGAFLLGYVTWSLGGWRWLLPPLVLFLAYPLFGRRTERNVRRVHSMNAILSVSLPGLLWLFASKLFERPEWLLPYVISFAAHLAMIGVVRTANTYRMTPGWILVIACAMISWLIYFAPYVLWETVHLDGTWTLALKQSSIALAGVAVAASFFCCTHPAVRECPSDVPRWVRQGVHASLASLIGLFGLVN